MTPSGDGAYGFQGSDRLGKPSASYLAQVASRIVRTFEMYVRNIDPDDEGFKAFVSNYLEEKGMRNPETVQYSELYKTIKGSIREYMKQQQPRKRLKE